KGIEEFRIQAREYGLVLSKDALAAGEKFGDTLNLLTKIVMVTKTAIGLELLPTLTEVMEGMIEFAKANREVITANLKAFLQGTISLVKNLVTVVTTVATVFSFFAQAVGGSTNAIKLLIGAFIAFRALALARNLIIITTSMWGLYSSVIAVRAVA